MKELTGTARNYYFLNDDDDKLTAQCEIILIVSEPQYRLGAGELIRERVSETMRVGINRKGVKLLIATLTEIDKDLEEMEKKSQVWAEAHNAVPVV